MKMLDFTKTSKTYRTERLVHVLTNAPDESKHWYYVGTPSNTIHREIYQAFKEPLVLREHLYRLCDDPKCMNPFHHVSTRTATPQQLFLSHTVQVEGGHRYWNAKTLRFRIDDRTYTVEDASDLLFGNKNKCSDPKCVLHTVLDESHKQKES